MAGHEPEQQQAQARECWRSIQRTQRQHGTHVAIVASCAAAAAAGALALAALLALSRWPGGQGREKLGHYAGQANGLMPPPSARQRVGRQGSRETHRSASPVPTPAPPRRHRHHRPPPPPRSRHPPPPPGGQRIGKVTLR